MTLHALKTFDETQFADMIHLYEIDIGQDDFDLEFEDITEVDLPFSPCSIKYDTDADTDSNSNKTEDLCSSRWGEKEILFNDIACFKGQDLDSIDENALNSLFQEMPLLDLEEFHDEEDTWEQVEKSEYCSIECNRCGTTFPDRRAFLSHSGPCFNKDLIEYTCTTCSKSFTRYLLFRLHCLRHVPEKHVCIFCEGEFEEQSALVSHISAAHSSFYPYTCKECGLLCPSRNLLSHHQTNNHNKGYACNICNRVLFLKRNLVRHIRVHNSGKLYMCDACGKLFLYKTSLMHHLANIHATDTPYACNQCHKRFAEEVFLKRHQKLHTEMRPFICEVCTKSFKTNAALNTHLLTHDYQKRYLCPKCNKGFTKISKLKEHENIHTGQRPFRCTYCLRSFTNSPNMLKHVKRMHFGKKIVSKQRKKKKHSNMPEQQVGFNFQV